MSEPKTIGETAVIGFYGVVDAWSTIPADERRAWQNAARAVLDRAIEQLACADVSTAAQAMNELRALRGKP